MLHYLDTLRTNATGECYLPGSLSAGHGNKLSNGGAFPIYVVEGLPGDAGVYGHGQFLYSTFPSLAGTCVHSFFSLLQVWGTLCASFVCKIGSAQGDAKKMR